MKGCGRPLLVEFWTKIETHQIFGHQAEMTQRVLCTLGDLTRVSAGSPSTSEQPYDERGAEKRSTQHAYAIPLPQAPRQTGKESAECASDKVGDHENRVDAIARLRDQPVHAGLIGD